MIRKVKKSESLNFSASTPELGTPEIGTPIPKIGTPTPKIASKRPASGTLRSHLRKLIMRSRDQNGRYVKDAAFGNAIKTEKDISVMNKFWRVLRSIFDWNFIASFIRFLTGYVLVKATPMQPITNNKSTLFTAWFYISNFISKFVGWSIVVTIIFSLFQLISQAIKPYIISISTYFYGPSKYSLFSLLSNYRRSFSSPPKAGLFSWIPTYWQNASAQAPWWSATWIKVVLVIVAAVLSLIVMRKLWLALLKVLVHIFGWVTPGDLERAQHMVKIRVDNALDEVRTLGNTLSVMEKSLDEVSKTTQGANEVMRTIEQFRGDVKTIHEIVGQLEKTKTSIYTRLDKFSVQQDSVEGSVYATLKHIQDKALKELEKAHTPRGIMGKELLDQTSLNSTYRKMINGPRRGLASILTFSDPVGEEMGGWRDVFEKKFKLKHQSDPSTSGYSSDSESVQSPGPRGTGLRSTSPKQNASGHAEQLEREHADAIKANNKAVQESREQLAANLQVQESREQLSANLQVQEAEIVKIIDKAKPDDGTQETAPTNPEPENNNVTQETKTADPVPKV